MSTWSLWSVSQSVSQFKYLDCLTLRMKALQSLEMLRLLAPQHCVSLQKTWIFICIVVLEASHVGDAKQHGTRCASVQVSTLSMLKYFLSSLLCIGFKLVIKQTQVLKCHVIHIYICYTVSFSTKAVAACLLTKLEPESTLESYGFWHHEVGKLGFVFHCDLLPHLLVWSDCININLDAIT